MRKQKFGQAERLAQSQAADVQQRQDSNPVALFASLTLSGHRTDAQEVDSSSPEASTPTGK